MSKTKSRWEENSIQFPRLLAEILATQDGLDVTALSEAMDLSVEEIDELFDRASEAWESAKAGEVEAIFSVAGWSDAYAAFTGAFNTPVMRRKVNDEYAEDARRRLAEINEAIMSAANKPSYSTVLDCSKMTRQEMIQYIDQQNAQIAALQRQLEAKEHSNQALQSELVALKVTTTAPAQMTTTTLFALAKLADTITVAGYTAESQCIEDHFGPDRPRTLRLSCTDDVDYHFVDQEVTLLDDGQVLAYDCCEDEDEPQTLYRLRFTVERPLTAADLLPTSP